MRLMRVGGVALTELGFGCAPIGNLFRAIDDETAIEAVRTAYDAGIRYFDTAPHYGLGLSERRLGAALAGLPRDSYAISTKVGRLLVPTGEGHPATDDANGFQVPATYRRVWDFSRDGVLRSVEASLARLGLDRVDMPLLHDPEESGTDAVEEGLPALAELRESGAVGAIGVGTKRVEAAVDMVRKADVDVVMIAGRYTLLEQGALDALLPLCQERRVFVVAVGVFNSGLLATERPGTTYEYAPAPPDVLARATRLAGVCGEYGVPLPAAALRFPGAHPAVKSVVMGCRTAAEVRSNVDYFARPIPPELWSRLRDESLLPPGAPIPRPPQPGRH